MQMILRTENWRKKNAMRSQYGFVAAIVYDHPVSKWGIMPACDQRLRVKEWAYKKLGRPAYLIKDEIVNPEAEWFMGQLKKEEYTVAFKNVKYRNWALLL